MTHGNIPPGWYDDGQGAQRYWDGAAWTEHTQPAPPAEPAAPAEPAQPAVDLSSEPTRMGPPPTGDPAPAPAAEPPVALDKGAGSTPQAEPDRSAPSADVTMIAPAGSFGQPAQPSSPSQPSQPSQPSYGQPGQPAYGSQPAQPAYGQPAPGQPAYGAPGAAGAAGAPAWQNQFPTGPSGSGGKGKLIAIIGGAAAAVLLGIVLLVVLIGGGGPGDVAGDYIDAQSELDFEKICELTAEDQQDEAFAGAGVDDCGEFADSFDDQFPDEIRDYLEDLEFDIEIGDVDEDGDEATVDYEVTTKYTGDDEDGFKAAFSTEDLEQTEDDSIDLVKEDGEWKVAEGIQ